MQSTLAAALVVAQGGGVSFNPTDLAATLATASPALMLAIFIIALSRSWLILPRELIRLQKECERERLETKAITDTFALRQQADLDEARAANAELTETIIEKVVPAVTRVAGPLTELVEFKRAQSRRRGQDDGD